MSGFTNVTGFAPPTSIACFMGLLQTASFRGVPFKVIAAQVKKGRRQSRTTLICSSLDRHLDRYALHNI